MPSPALFAQIGNRFVREVKAFAATNNIPILRLSKPDRSRWDDRKVDHVRPYVEAAEADGRFGVVAIVFAQEFQWVFSGRNRLNTPGVVSFDFARSSRRVGTHYFYVRDREFGLGFIKICTYSPYPAKVWVNGHEWAKCHADRAGIGYTALANGFATCDDPEALQEICDRFGPTDVQGFVDRCTSLIPTPSTPADRAAGYWWELSMRQVEVSRTIVLDDPRRARSFFEALVADNIGIGRPHEVHAVFGRDRRGRTTSKQFRTRIFSPATEVKMDFAYKRAWPGIDKIPRTNTYRTHPTGSAPQCSTPSSDHDSSARSSTPAINHPHPSNYGAPSPQLTAPSTPTSPTPDSAPPHENSSQNSRAPPPRDLRTDPHHHAKTLRRPRHRPRRRLTTDCRSDAASS